MSEKTKLDLRIATDVEFERSGDKLYVKHKDLESPVVLTMPKDTAELNQFIERLTDAMVKKRWIMSDEREEIANRLKNELIGKPKTEEKPFEEFFKPLEEIKIEPEEFKIKEEETVQIPTPIPEPEQEQTLMPEVKPPEEIKPTVTPVPTPTPTPTVTPERYRWVNDLNDEQRSWLKRIAEINHIDINDYVEDVTKRAESSFVHVHPIVILYNDALNHQLVMLRKEKVQMVVLAVPTADPEEIQEYRFVTPANRNIKIGKCYEIRDVGKTGRCIAVSNPVSAAKYEGSGMPRHELVVEHADMVQIPAPHECFVPIYLSKALELAKDNPLGIYEAICGMVIDFRNPRDDLYYLIVNDGTLDNPYITSVGPLTSDNPWDISIEQIEQSKGKNVLIFGYIRYSPAEEGPWERLTINPSFLMFG